MNLTAIILAGGKSSRMGEDKGLVLLKGKPMIQYLLDLFLDLKIPVIIIANNSQYKKFGVPVFSDIIKNKGPLSGIYSGLYHSKTEKNFIVSCDIPFLSKNIVEFLIENTENEMVTVLSLNEKIQPLTGVYSKKLKNKILFNLYEDKLKLRTFIQSVDYKSIDIIDSVFENVENALINVNTKTELIMLENGK